jgi:hypothetical protein
MEKNDMGGAVACIGERRGVYRVWWGNLKETDHMGDQVVDGRVLLRWIFRKWTLGVLNGFSCLSIGTAGGHL